MSSWLDRLGAALLDASLAATAMTGLVVLAMLQCRQPARRIGWARSGMLASLALLPLAALNPVPRIDLRGPIRSFVSNIIEDSIRGFSTHDLERSYGSIDDRLIASKNDDQRRPSTLRRICRAVVVVYLIGTFLGLSWIGLGLWGSSLLIRRSLKPSPWLAEFYESILLTENLVRPELRVSSKTSRPVLVGSFGPVILIPTELDAPESADRLKLSLLHELAHVENHDHHFGLLALLAQTIWFFLPPLWWLRDQLKLDQEFLADRRAVSLFGTSGRYATSLVELASGTLAGRDECLIVPVVPTPMPISSMASALVQRVQMLVKCPFPIEATTPTWWRWSTVLTLSLVTLATSCLTLRGLDGWSAPDCESFNVIPQPFRLPQLVISPGEHQEPVLLRYRLPRQFTLTLEVSAEPAELQFLEVLGHRLGPADEADASSEVDGPWHRVVIRRVQGFESVEVDGRPIHSSFQPGPPATWLTIRPLPGQPTRIRDLAIE